MPLGQILFRRLLVVGIVTVLLLNGCTPPVAPAEVSVGSTATPAPTLTARPTFTPAPTVTLAQSEPMITPSPTALPLPADALALTILHTNDVYGHIDPCG